MAISATPPRNIDRCEGIPGSLDQSSPFSRAFRAFYKDNAGAENGSRAEGAFRRHSRRASAPNAEDDRGDGDQRAGGDEEEHPARITMIEELAEDERRHHAADVQSGGHKAEHLAEG